LTHTGTLKQGVIRWHESCYYISLGCNDCCRWATLRMFMGRFRCSLAHPNGHHPKTKNWSHISSKLQKRWATPHFKKLP